MPHVRQAPQNPSTRSQVTPHAYLQRHIQAYNCQPPPIMPYHIPPMSHWHFQPHYHPTYVGIHKVSIIQRLSNIRVQGHCHQCWHVTLRTNGDTRQKRCLCNKCHNMHCDRAQQGLLPEGLTVHWCSVLNEPINPPSKRRSISNQRDDDKIDVKLLQTLGWHNVTIFIIYALYHNLFLFVCILHDRAFLLFSSFFFFSYFFPIFPFFPYFSNIILRLWRKTILAN